MGGVTHTNAKINAPTGQVVEHSQVLGEANGMIKGHQADVGTKAHMLGHTGHGGRHRHPARQVAIVDKVVLGKPHQICADIIEPFHLFEYFRVKMLIADTRVWRVSKIVGHPHAQRWLRI